MILLEKELNRLKQKHNENMQSAYANIIKSEAKNYKYEIEVILDYFGIDCGVESDLFEKQLEEIKNKYDINYRIITLSDDWYKNSMLPLLVRDGDLFKAAIPDFNGKCHCYINKKRTKFSNNNTNKIKKEALCFYRGFGLDKISRLSLIKYMLKCISIKDYLMVTVLMIAVMLFSTVMPQTQYYIFNNLIPSGTKGDIFPISCLLLGIIIASLMIYIFRGIITANIPICIGANLQGAVISRFLNLKACFFTKQKSGSLSNSIIKISNISQIFSGEIIAALMSFLLSFIYAFEIYIYAKEFIGYVYFSFAVVFILTVVNTFFLNKYSSRLSERTNEMTGFVYELFGGMENVKLNNADSIMFNRWSGFYSQSLKAQKKPLIIKYYKGIYAFIISVFTLIIYTTGIREQTSAASFITFMALYGLFIGSVGGIALVFNAVADFNSVYNCLSEFFNAEIEETNNKLNIDKFSGNIEFSNVSFKYPNSNNYVLENISFDVKKGQKIGIKGNSGCGKSTLIRLLLGFENPEKGRIFIDNKDLNEINLSSYRKKIGVVLQSSKLIPGDIFSNITLTTPTATYDDVNKVVDIVGLREDIEKMPMGLHTFVSDDNLTISGGQKQRILLARAILCKPSLLVLDEATNALDNITQAAITRYINLSNSTAIIVAHRLSTIKNCDNIIVIDSGKAVEQGNFDELLEKKGVFYDLIKNQM